MRVLLDNCVNHRFANLLGGQEVVHVRHLGWSDLSNGKLLAAAEEQGFDVLLTVDQNARLQLNLKGRHISLVTLDARSITLAGIMPFVPLVMLALAELQLSNATGQDILVRLPKA